MAAKISISLPEALKERLDRYAQEQAISVSQVVQKALEGLLDGPAPPPPPPPPPDGHDSQELTLLRQLVLTTRSDVSNLQRYLAFLSQNLEHHRECLCVLAPLTPLGLPVPPPIPPPPLPA